MGRAREVGVLGGSKRGDELHLALSEKGGEHQRQQDRREGELQIDHAHDEGLAAPASIGRADAERNAQREGDGTCHQPHLQGDAQAVENGREQVAPLRIGAEPMCVAALADIARRAARIGERELGEVVRVLRGDERREQGDADRQDDDGERDDGRPALAELGPEAGYGRGVLHRAPPFRSLGSSPT